VKTLIIKLKQILHTLYVQVSLKMAY